MPNTFTQIYVQFVFAVKFRDAVIGAEWEEELYKYITGITRNLKHKMIAVNGMQDHIHMFVGLDPGQSLSTFIQVVKGDSSEWINKRGFVKDKFRWQAGFGAFSYSHTHLDKVYHYVLNQKEHHKKITFDEEYQQLLTEFEVAFDQRYIFKPLE